MAFGVSSWAVSAYSWASTIFLWIIFFVIAVVMIFIVLTTRKRKKLSYPTIIVTNLGSKKAGFEITKSGWFKSKTFFFGLLDIGGEMRMLTKDGREVQKASSADFQQINFRRGLILQRKADDPKILVPIKYTSLDKDSRELINSIAPADFRDASVKIMDQAQTETAGRVEKFLAQALPFIMIGGFVVSLILVIQYAKHSQAESWTKTLEAIKMSYQNKGAVIESLAPMLLAWRRRWIKF